MYILLFTKKKNFLSLASWPFVSVKLVFHDIHASIFS